MFRHAVACPPGTVPATARNMPHCVESGYIESHGKRDDAVQLREVRVAQALIRCGCFAAERDPPMSFQRRRFLQTADAEFHFDTGAWDGASRARLLENGAVQLFSARTESRHRRLRVHKSFASTVLFGHAVLLLMVGALLVPFARSAAAQTAVIKEEIRNIKTYPFSDRDPNPILIRDPRLYPYHVFDGYSHDGRSMPWKVVRLENDFIEVYVLPDVGGKVWGAVEKSTGEEFIYRNEVLKFRNIALRGPWTSGGIEFNFGVIGHAPATATPVDYALDQHEDGSVTCVVGAMDLPSRTQWRVQIHLPGDRAYFETRSLWYNPTPVMQSYYNWMTGAAVARNDLELTFPGNQYLKHSGEAKPWPVDAQGRTLSHYDNNRFGSHKSYHVVGEHADFFGGYYHDAGYGFGHWAPYGDMPGQKLWLWALSREGGIWEDLLTDTDGQYVEFQAGRLLVQYSPGEHTNPICQDGFEPYRTDRWNERWFPIKGIGGMSTASGQGVMHVERKDDVLQVGINAFETVTGTLEVVAADSSLYRRTVVPQTNGGPEHDNSVPWRGRLRGDRA